MSQQTLEQYQIIAQIPSGYVLMHKEKQEISVFKTVFSPLDYENQLQLLQARQEIKCDNLLKIIDYQILESDENGTKTNFIYEGWNLDLEEEFNKRSQNQQYFEENELRNIFSNIAQGILALHQRDLIHGDLRANSIAFTDQYDVKVIDQWGFGDVYFKNKQQIFLEKQSYVSPEILQNSPNVFNGQNDFDNNNNQEEEDVQDFYATKTNDIFSLGLIFLEICLLENSKQYYDYDKLQFNTDLLNRNLQNVKKYYSQEIFQLIYFMCDLNPQKRIDIFSIISYIKQYLPVQQKQNNFQQQQQQSHIQQQVLNTLSVQQQQQQQNDISRLDHSHFSIHPPSGLREMQDNYNKENIQQFQQFNNNNGSQIKQGGTNYIKYTQQQQQQQPQQQQMPPQQNQSHNLVTETSEANNNIEQLNNMLDKCLSETRNIIEQQQKRKIQQIESLNNSLHNMSKQQLDQSINNQDSQQQLQQQQQQQQKQQQFDLKQQQQSTIQFQAQQSQFLNSVASNNNNQYQQKFQQYQQQQLQKQQQQQQYTEQTFKVGSGIGVIEEEGSINNNIQQQNRPSQKQQQQQQEKQQVQQQQQQGIQLQQQQQFSNQSISEYEETSRSNNQMTQRMCNTNWCFLKL